MQPEPLLPEAAVSPHLIVVVSIAIVVLAQWRFLAMGRPHQAKTGHRTTDQRRGDHVIVPVLLLASGLLLVGPVFSAVGVAAGKTVYVRGGVIRIGLEIGLSIALLYVARRRLLRDVATVGS